jgi:hypothetical protein
MSTDLILEHLEAIRGDIATIRKDVREIKNMQSGMQQLLDASGHHLKGIDAHLDRIERKLTLDAGSS